MLFIGNRWVQICDRRLRQLEDTILGLLIGSSTSTKQTTKTRFQYCKNSQDVLLYISAIQGHTGGNVIMSIFHSNGNSCFIEDALMMSRQSSGQDISLEEEKAMKEGKPSSSHLSTRLGTIQMRQIRAMTIQNPEKYTITASGSLLRTLVN